MAAVESQELIRVQNELKKAIQTHQQIIVKLKHDSNDSLKNELRTVQQHIQELGEKQKSIISSLRKEKETKCRVEITSNGESKCSPQLQSQKTQVSLPTKKSFLVSKADTNNGNGNNSTTTNSNSNSSNNKSNSRKLPQPALAVRTISGQTKLLVPVSAAAATAKKQNQHKQILVVPTPGGGARLATSAANSSSVLRSVRVESKSSTNNCGNNLNASNSSNHKSLLASSKSLSNNSQPNHSLQQQQNITRHQLMMKEQHAKALQEELKIPEPKRKETFLAALGLVTKEALSEIQNKKCERKRRTTANPQFSNAAIEAKRITALEVAAKRAKRRMLLAQAATAAAAKTSRNFLQTSSTRPRVGQKVKDAIAEKTSNSHSPTVTISSSRSLSCSKVSNNCFVCDEHCDPDLDAVMFCKDCKCLFHATCASNIDDITKTMTVPCPKCDKQKPLEEEVGPIESSTDEEEVLANKIRKSDKMKMDPLFARKLEERNKLKRKSVELSDECDQCKKRLAKLQADLSASEEEKRIALIRKAKVSKDLDRLITVIESVRCSPDSLSNGDRQQEKKDGTEGRESGCEKQKSTKTGSGDCEPSEQLTPMASTILIPSSSPPVSAPTTDVTVILDEKSIDLLVINSNDDHDEKVDQFEDETSAAVASIAAIQEQIEVDL